jgi:hypothetical protein
MEKISINSWVLSSGGPFALMGSSKYQRWGGDESVSATSILPPFGNDYTRACRFGVNEGILSDNDGEIFVFFGEMLEAGFFHFCGELFLICPIVSGAISSDKPIPFSAQFSNQQKELFKYFNCDGQVTLIDSSDSKKNKNQFFIEMPSGWYTINTFQSNLGNMHDFGVYQFYRFSPFKI